MYKRPHQSSCIGIVVQGSQKRTKPNAGEEGIDSGDPATAPEHAVIAVDITRPDDLAEDHTESDDEDDDLTQSEDPSSSSSSDDDEGLTDPEDRTDPEDASAIQRTVNRKRMSGARRQRFGDPSTGHSRSQRHKYIWAEERRALRTTSLKMAQALRPKPASARDAFMHRRSTRIVQEMCTYLTDQDAVEVFNQLKVS
jgi:hypothetical protein